MKQLPEGLWKVIDARHQRCVLKIKDKTKGLRGFYVTSRFLGNALSGEYELWPWGPTKDGLLEERLVSYELLGEW